MTRTRWASGSLLATAIAAVATPAQADVVIGPRFSYYFDNSNLRTSDLQGVQDARSIVNDRLSQDLNEADPFVDDYRVVEQNNGQSVNSDQVAFPMIGAMVNFGNDRDRFTLTGMVGKGSATTELIASRSLLLEAGDIGFREISIIQTVIDEDIDRIDFEASWQRRLSESFALSGGLRYERLSVTGEGLVTIQETDEVRQVVAEVLGEEAPSRNLDGARQPALILTDRQLETFSARLGVTAFVPANRSTVFFFNGMVHASHQPGVTLDTDFFGVNGDIVREESVTDASETSIGPDIAVGAQFTLANNIALDLRYRAILFFPLSGQFEFSDARVNHGVNLGLSFRL